MKKTFINRAAWAVVVSAAIGMTGCDKILDTSSPSQLSSSDIFKTPSRIAGLVNGAYKSLKSAGGRLFLNADIRGEEFINLTNNAYTGFDGWANNYSGSSADVASVWESYYATINNVNILIDGLEKTTGVISEEQKKQYVAEARFIRAVSYFSLVTLYARPYAEGNGAGKALPLRLLPETSVANKDLARSTVAQVYEQILKDLDVAETNLPEKYGTNELNTTRAHRNTAIAFKTRVYLNIGQYPNVVKEAVKIVPQADAPFAATTGVLHALQTNIVTIFSSNYTTTESVFSFPVTQADGPVTALGASYNANADFSLNTEGIHGSTQWGASDARRNMVRLNTANSQYFLTKYAKPSPFLDYIPVVRYAEVLLNYAEAAARTGNQSLAVKLLKAVHGRSDAGYVFAAGDIDTETNLVNTIWKERRIELLGEGFRSNDLLRNLLTIPAKRSSSFNARAVPPTDAAYVWSIPNTEIVSNKLINQ
ncbi:RagB/SusD family nutrient uptake outer membrane protein [Paraflavitalea pollutisoli]|uniref:RagB/SusD family nutrient uptake outer membrane protein n=1 Tax=Paraflavitalea pollutisoli TaxID=3034143 RepID=UPI0023EB1C5D|nr:RagB/SusD family nutrient uptake outer membrane protein [Paraflavitalea sp. H1-2-19X]